MASRVAFAVIGSGLLFVERNESVGRQIRVVDAVKTRRYLRLAMVGLAAARVFERADVDCLQQSIIDEAEVRRVDPDDDRDQPA
jgi:hypothetical protein